MKKRRNDNNGDGDGEDKMKKKKDDANQSQELDKILKSALNNYLMSQASEVKNKTRDIEALKATIEEFLNSYILLGYSPSGDPVHVISAHNQQEADSLSALLNKFIMNQSDGHDKNFPF
jgi:hypothetical protein